jgi:small-conductance mechanosensitive channel/CRP-like cAMP-binding protein
MTPTLIPAAILVAITALGALGLRRFSNRVRITFDSALFIAISIYLLSRRVSPIFPPPSGTLDSAALWMRAIGGAWWWLASRIIVAFLWFSFHRNPRARQTTLFSDLFGAVIYIAMALIVLNSVFALPVTGLLATSGVLAIVLGLALQNTLADVFAGMAVDVEAPFSVGDRIQIDENIEGQVVQVNWRSIRIQTDGDDIAIIPNSHIAKAEIINRSFPSQRRAASVELSCPESNSPERVIDILQQATLLCPDILRTPAPTAVLTRLGPKRNIYEISFFVESTKRLSTTKDMLLRSSRRQLYYIGLLESRRQPASRDKTLSNVSRTTCRLLHDLVLFECLTEEQIETLADKLRARLLEPGEALFAQGATDATLYVVASGILELTRQAGADAAETLGCIGAGEYVGEIGLLTGAPHAATATARTHCRIYQLPRDAIAPLLSTSSELASAFDKSARHGLDILHRQVAVRATENVGARDQLLPRIRNLFHFRPE